MNAGYPPNFRSSEFHCKCDGRFCDGPSPHPDRTRHLAWTLQRLRNAIGAALRINSGYRCSAYNKLVGGSTNSYHVKGMAADVSCDGVSAEDVADTIEGLMEEKLIPNGGLGRYETFTHMDIRPMKARWSG